MRVIIANDPTQMGNSLSVNTSTFGKAVYHFKVQTDDDIKLAYKLDAARMSRRGTGTVSNGINTT